MSKPTNDELKNRFFFQRPPNQARIEDHEEVARITYDLALQIRNLVPAGRNLALALTHLEDVRMRANAALACDSPED